MLAKLAIAEIIGGNNGFQDSARNLVLAAERIPTKLMVEVPAAATYGSLHVRAAVVAARVGKSDQVQDHLSEDRLFAARVPEDVYYAPPLAPRP